MKVLFVEDSRSLQHSLSAGLRNSGMAVDQAFDGVEAESLLCTNRYDVVLLDLMLPKLGGLEVLKRLRRRGDNTFVLILSAMDEVEDRTKGLDLGADDYLIKPFSFDELASRLRALYRRSNEHAVTRTSIMKIGNVVIDTSNRTVTLDEEFLGLTPSEYKVLVLLAARRGQTFSHDQLIERLYQSEKYVTRNAVEAHVSALRKKLRMAGAVDVIQTRRGFGYFIA